jgi:nucleotide-binding universal stress UspA family protein
MIGPMDPMTILLCTDGSELALGALRAALPVLAPATRTVVLTVTAAEDPTLVVGTGFAGGVMSPDEQEALLQQERSAAQELLDEAVAALGLADAETVILTGNAGQAICDLAASLPADVVVIGTRGHGGLRRAVMGSTSDHVVRHAPCPVLVHGEE